METITEHDWLKGSDTPDFLVIDWDHRHIVGCIRQKSGYGDRGGESGGRKMQETFQPQHAKPHYRLFDSRGALPRRPCLKLTAWTTLRRFMTGYSGAGVKPSIPL